MFPLLLGLALLVQGPPTNQDRQPVVRLEDLGKILVARSPEIRAAMYRHDAATKRPSQVSTLPEPKVSYTNFGVGHPFSTLDISDFAYQGFGVSQELPYPGKLALAAEEAKREADVEKEQYRALVIEKTAELKTVYYDWFATVKSIEVAEKSRDLLERVERIARARYEVGKGIQQDVLKAQVDLSTLAQQAETLSQKRASIEAKLQALLNAPLPPGRPADLTATPLPASMEQILASLDTQAPRLRASQAMVDSKAVAIERSKKDYLPDFGFGFQWQKTGGPYRDYYMTTAEVKIPIFFWRKQRLGVEEASARLKESRENYEAARQEVVFMVKDLYLTASSSERLLALYRSGVIPQSSLSLESAMAGYETGKVDFLTLLANFTGLLTYEMQYYQELARHEQAIAKLEGIVSQIKPEVKP